VPAIVNITTLLDGEEHCIIQVYLQSQGEELVQETLIDPQQLEPACKRLAVDSILYDFAGFDARLEFDSGGVEQRQIWVLPEGSGSGHRDFRQYGSFADRSSSLDGNGKLYITTTGFTTAGVDQGSIFLRVKKNSRVFIPE
jgi:hypothetical protein